MVICKYFLQGTCKFGDNCKFEHQVNDHNYGTNSVMLRQSYPSKPPPTSNVDTNTLVKAVVTDMTSAEKGGQWLLSSYAPFREKPAFPGFEDHSMEEVRHLFYEAAKTGSIEQYKQNLQMMLQQAMMRIKALQNPSPEAVSMLKTIYDTPSSSSSAQSPFGASVFGGPQTHSQSVFGAPTNANQGIFGGGAGQQGSFGGGSSGSIFGRQAAGGAAFGGQSAGKSIFGGQTNNSSVFGGAPVFGGGAQQSIFAKQPAQQSPFGQSQQLPFRQQPPQQQQNIFQQGMNRQVPGQFEAPPNATFGNTQSPFGAPQNFAATQAPAQAVAPTPQSQPAFQHTQAIFGNLGLQTNSANVFGNTVQMKPNESYYSKLEDLTEEEIRWYQSDDLDLMSIPEKPPTYEMCFKV